MSTETAQAADDLPPLFAELSAWAGNDGAPQLRVLDSVAQFTHHRDIDALDHSLTLSLAELADAHVVTLYKRSGGRGDPVEGLVRCARDEHDRYSVVSLQPASDDTAQMLLRQGDRDGGCVRLRDGNHGMLVPIRREGRVMGALMLEGEHPMDGLRALVEGFARIYANYIALLDESERDKLTGLYNRRTFERHMQRQTKRLDDGDAEQPSTPRWLAMLDIDHFKRINDTWGHLYGDEVILVIAQQMRASFRQNDALFRFGGEEFLVLLEADDEATAGIALERFRSRVQAHVFPQIGQVTVSVGYAAVGEHDYPATVIDRADKALYYAKNHGRNKVFGYEDLRTRGALDDSKAAGSVDLF
ncbi:GGDEF domain-containing protein [Dyella sp.]|jgi:diguanylate cyclase (GGDEF)-like protein|uniref:GGDEF domain-containing protein n=1 Tax=Dyella sp. TaxID=1869338 RepID=UPI002D79D436|nr:GGDEF domain-containing protein [Dyella sp.]HET6431534.1 GGDEF domain-containing protein [Dyella sp.]